MRLTAILLSAAMIALAMLHPEPGAAAPPVTSNLMVPLDLVVEGSDEDIAVTGILHVVTDVLVNEEAISLRAHTNFVNTKGIGLKSLAQFNATGPHNQQLNTNLEPPGPESPPVHVAPIYERLTLLNDKLGRQVTEMIARMVFDMRGNLVGVTVERFPLPCD